MQSAKLTISPSALEATCKGSSTLVAHNGAFTTDPAWLDDNASRVVAVVVVENLTARQEYPNLFAVASFFTPTEVFLLPFANEEICRTYIQANWPHATWEV